MLLLTGNGFHKKISAINLKNITCRRYDRSSADNFARTDPKMINCLLSADIMSKAFSCRLLMRKSHVFRSDQLLISVLVIASIKDLCKPNQESGTTSREDLTTAQKPGGANYSDPPRDGLETAVSLIIADTRFIFMKNASIGVIC